MAQLRSPILANDAKLIEDFIDSLGALKKRRQDKYRYALNRISRELGPFEKANYKDLKSYVEKINVQEDFTDWTKRDYRLIIKKFFGWLRNKDFVAWIKVGGVKTRIGPEDVLSESELSRLRHVCTNLRDKTLLETLYETACRPHEFLSFKRSSVSFDEYGALVYVEKGKTGPRRIRVVNAAPLLANWVENHPLKSKEAPLWVDLSSNTQYQGLKWIGLKRLIQRLVENAHIEKKVHPYLFRHTRLTHFAKFMTEAQLCEFAGWEQGSPMSAMYVHLSGRDVDDALLKAYGLKKEADTLIAKGPRKCVRCQSLCEAQAETCSKCGMALTMEAALKKDDELKKMQAEIADLRKDAGEFRDLMNSLKLSVNGKVEIIRKDPEQET